MNEEYYSEMMDSLYERVKELMPEVQPEMHYLSEGGCFLSLLTIGLRTEDMSEKRMCDVLRGMIYAHVSK